mmetsp:Transcript_42839/g.142593  ORF Transcript_42839/g.142593 Transcript_42839/m.142593 type:complete len:301 (+) Transcript_42839:293-1195(+)
MIGSTAQFAPARAVALHPPTRPVRPPGLRRQLRHDGGNDAGATTPRTDAFHSPEITTPRPPASWRALVQSEPCSQRGNSVLRGAYPGAATLQGTCSSFTSGRWTAPRCVVRASTCGVGIQPTISLLSKPSSTTCGVGIQPTMKSKPFTVPVLLLATAQCSGSIPSLFFSLTARGRRAAAPPPLPPTRPSRRRSAAADSRRWSSPWPPRRRRAAAPPPPPPTLLFRCTSPSRRRSAAAVSLARPSPWPPRGWPAAAPQPPPPMRQPRRPSAAADSRPWSSPWPSRGGPAAAPAPPPLTRHA